VANASVSSSSGDPSENIDSVAVWCFNHANADEEKSMQVMLDAVMESLRGKGPKKEKFMVMFSVQMDRAFNQIQLIFSSKTDNIKAWAVRSCMQDQELVAYMNFIRSPLGLKYLQYSSLADSLEPEEALLKVDFTMAEISELNKHIDGGIIAKFNEADAAFSAKYQDSTTRLLRAILTENQKRAMLDPFLFLEESPSTTQTAEDRRSMMEAAYKEMLDEARKSVGEGGSVPAMSQEEIQRALMIASAIRIGNAPKPCDRYVCKWGASAETVIKEAEHLKMKLRKDTTDDHGTRILDYGVCTFYVHKDRGYHKISTDHRVSGMMNLMQLSADKADAKWFTESWTLVDSDSMSGYGKCENNPNAVVIHSSFSEHGRKRAFVECLPMAQ
jgi:hypothetical protein